MCRLCWVSVVFLFLVSSGLIYQLFYQQEVAVNNDDHIAIPLTGPEKNQVLNEMRAFLQSVQQITEGISKSDLKQVTESARRVGRASQNDVPSSLAGKLPLEFKKLGFDTHTRFDLLALDAEQLGDEMHALNQLSILMQNCVAYHASYRIHTNDSSE